MQKINWGEGFGERIGVYEMWDDFDVNESETFFLFFE